MTLWSPYVSAASSLRNVLLCPNTWPPPWATLPLIWGSPLPLMSLKPPPLIWDIPASRARHHPATATGTARCGAPGAPWWTATLTAQEPASSAQWTAATPATAPTSAAGWLQQGAWVEPPCQVSGCRAPPPTVANTHPNPTFILRYFTIFTLHFILNVLLNLKFAGKKRSWIYYLRWPIK